jgi:beta-galactosidase
VQGSIILGGKSYNWNNWGDVLEPLPGTEVWATYTNQFYAGKAAVVSRKWGKGTVTYVGPDTDDGALEEAVLRQVYERASIPIEDLPEGVLIDWRDGFWVGVNYGEKPYTVSVPVQSKVLIGDKVLNTADVLVWKD